MRPRQGIASANAQGTGRITGNGDARRVARSLARASLAALATLATCSIAAAGNPLSAIGETFSDWKDRLFGKPKPTLEAPAEGPIALEPGHPTRLRIDKAAPERDFPRGRSHYRIVELPESFDHAAVRIQVTALPREHAFGHEVLKPFLYTLDADGGVRDTVEVKPLHLDIRPFRRTRLLGCAMLEKVARFAVATEPGIVGKSYESEVRDAIKAPTQGGFYYATDAVKVKLPYAETGELTLEVTKEPAAGKGC